MSNLDLDAIEKRADAATAGPWWAVKPSKRVHIRAASGVYIMAQTPGAVVQSGIEDAEFIAHSRTVVPALVAENRELRAEVERLNDLLSFPVKRTDSEL